MIDGTFMLGWFAGVLTWCFFPRRLRAYLCGVDGPRKYGRLFSGGYQPRRGVRGKGEVDLRKLRMPRGGSGVSRPSHAISVNVTGNGSVVVGGNMTVNHGRMSPPQMRPRVLRGP